jgi:hypothetical protein
LKKAAAALLYAVAVIAGVTAVQAAIPGAAGQIDACYRNANGSLRVIDTEAGQKCANNETGLTWNQQGPAGSGTEVVKQTPQSLTSIGAVADDTLAVPLEANTTYRLRLRPILRLTGGPGSGGAYDEQDYMYWVAEASGLTGASVEVSPDILDTVLPPRFNGYDVNYSITNETQVAENNDYVWIIETTSATTFTVNWRAVAYFHNGQSVTDPFDLSVRPGTTLEVDVI